VFAQPPLRQTARQDPKSVVRPSQRRQHVARPVGGTVVQHQDLKVGVVLGQQGTDTVSDDGLLVARGEQDGDAREARGKGVPPQAPQGQQVAQRDEEQNAQEGSDAQLVLEPEGGQ
jgi:hypothetical protein